MSGTIPSSTTQNKNVNKRKLSNFNKQPRPRSFSVPRMATTLLALSLLPALTAVPVAAAQPVKAVASCYVSHSQGKSQLTGKRANDDRAKYIVTERRANNGRWFWANRSSAATPAWSDTNQVDDRNYDYRMISVGIDGRRSVPRNCAESARPLQQCKVSYNQDYRSARLTMQRARGDNASKFIVERKRGEGPWYWAGRLAANDFPWHNRGLNNASFYEYRLFVVNSSNTRSEAVNCSDEWYRTRRIGGRWEIVKTEKPGQALRWQAVSLRADPFWIRDKNYVFDRAAIKALAKRFKTVRLVLHWEDVEPNEPTGPLDISGLNSSPQLNKVKKIIQLLGEEHVGVILDPMHGNDDSVPIDDNTRHGTFRVPDWAYRVAGKGSDPKQYHIDDHFEVAAFRTQGSRGTLGGDYLSRMLLWSQQFDNIIALELMNEPHPPRNRPDPAGPFRDTSVIINLFKDYWIPALRRIDPDKPLILSGFYGNQLADAAQVRAGLVANRNQEFSNLIWSAHSYWTGLPSHKDVKNDNGLFNVDVNRDGFVDGSIVRRASGFHWMLGFRAGQQTGIHLDYGCYAARDDYRNRLRITPFVWETRTIPCPPADVNVRKYAISNLIKAYNRQFQVAQAGNMPLFVGEFGHSRVWKHPATEKLVGFGHAKDLTCDRLQALDAVGASFAWWHFDAAMGRGYGLYDSKTHQWYDKALQHEQGARNGDQGTARVFIGNTAGVRTDCPRLAL